jgi:ABC-type branched-subunit amino acid transport system substrate-binding protein
MIMLRTSHRVTGLRMLIAFAVLVVGGLTGLSASAAGAAASSSPGVTAKTITIGLAGDITGPCASSMSGFVPGATSRIDEQNAKGGVDGRKLVLVTGNDQCTPTGGETAVDELIQTKNVFGILEDSTVLQLGDKLAHQDGVPLVGADIDGTDWGTPPYQSNMITTSGDYDPTSYAPTSEFDEQATVAKDAGATNVASLAIANIPPSLAMGTGFTSGAEKIGLKVGYTNYSIPLGTVDVGTTVLAMKAAGVNGFMSNMLEDTTLAVLEGAKQDGIKMKAALLITGYGQDVFANSTTEQAAQGGIFAVPQVPVELKTPATLAEQAAFKKYAHFSGIPDLNWTIGWTSADLMIKGLELAGKNPTRTAFVNDIHHLKGWDAEGVLPQASNFSLADFGKNPTTPTCEYWARLVGTKFDVINNGKPVCAS